MNMEFVRSLKLEDKLYPTRNPEISWCYVFLPAVIGYFVVLTNFLNAKPPIGEIEIFHPSFKPLLHPHQEMEIIATGSQWAEGPIWIDDENSGLGFLAYSDTKLNRIFRWDEGKGFFTVGKSLMIERSGCRANRTYCNEMAEPGSNGMLRMNAALMPIANAKSIDLLVCQHGERAVSLFRENGTRTQIATTYNGKRFNSPNDLIWSSDGHLLFTDPDYGLITKIPRYINENDTEPYMDRELPYNGIYMIRKDDLAYAVETGEPTDRVILLHSGMSKPNGLAFSPDMSKLYVSNSDPTQPIYNIFDVSPDTGALSNGRMFFNATSLRTCTSENDIVGNGLPDGLKVDIQGNLFTAGPGGVLVISPEGVLIGRFKLDRPVTNLAFGGDGRLYITLEDIVVRIKIKTKGSRIISSHFKRK